MSPEDFVSRVIISVKEDAFATEKEAILETIQDSKKIYFDGVFSHLSTAYFQDDFYARKQYSLFLGIKKYLEENDVKIPIYHI